MYRIGDKLKALANYEQLLAKGDIVEVTAVQPNDFISFYNKRNGVSSHWNWGAVASYFIPFKRPNPPKDDIEWLDRVQENFKNG